MTDQQPHPPDPRAGYYVRKYGGLTIMARTKGELRGAMVSIGADMIWGRIHRIPADGVRLPAARPFDPRRPSDG